VYQKALFFVNVITCIDIVAVLAWPSYRKKWHRSIARVTILATKNCQICQTKLLFFLVKVIAWLAKFWGMPWKTWKNLNLQNHYKTAVGGVTVLNIGARVRM